VNDFRPDRSQRRNLKTNADLHLLTSNAEYSDETFTLYRDYLQTRHSDSEMANCKADDFPGFLKTSWGETRFIELRIGSRLLAVAATDVLNDGLSAVYTWFDPRETKRGLGTHAILRQIDEARRLGLRWLYLGYWIPECRKMRYKIQYKPAQILTAGRWRALEDVASEIAEASAGR